MHTLLFFFGLVVAVVIGIAAERYLIGPGRQVAVAPPAASQAQAEAEALAPPPEAPAVRWKLASAYAGSAELLGTLAKWLIVKIDTLSQGTIKIQFFEPGALVPALEVFDAVSSGSVDAGWATPGFWAGKVPALQIFSSVPFGPRPEEYMAWMYFGGGREIFDELYGRFNIKSIPCGIFPPEASGWFKRPIKSADDLKGLKMRFFGLGALVMEKLGVSTQLLAGGDIYPALELGTIDASEYSSPPIDKDLGLYQIAKHYYFPGWHQPSTWIDLEVNLDRWNALDAVQKEIIETSCGDAIRRSLSRGAALQIPALKFFAEQGVTFHEWSPEILARYRTAWDEVAVEQAAKDPDFARAWESLSKFRADFAQFRDLGYIE